MSDPTYSTGSLDQKRFQGCVVYQSVKVVVRGLVGLGSRSGRREVGHR